VNKSVTVLAKATKVAFEATEVTLETAEIAVHGVQYVILCFLWFDKNVSSSAGCHASRIADKIRLSRAHSIQDLNVLPSWPLASIPPRELSTPKVAKTMHVKERAD
jgi:hypothetical protein